MELKELENRYRDLESDCHRIMKLKTMANSKDDIIFWNIEMLENRREMKKISQQFKDKFIAEDTVLIAA